MNEELTEGKEKKGGVNSTPTSKRPEPPKAQSDPPLVAVIGKMPVERDIIPTATPIFAGKTANDRLLKGINKMLGDRTGELFCYDLDYDDHDMSVELYLSPYCPPEFKMTEELRSFLIDESGFQLAFINYPDETEQVCGRAVEPIRKSNSGNLKRWIEFNGGPTREEQVMIDNWMNRNV